MKSDKKPGYGGLSVACKIGESILLNYDDKEIRLTLYKTARTFARVTIQAPKDVKISRFKKERIAH